MRTEAERQAQNRWAAKRRARAFAFLGGKCAVCGTRKDLTFDHIDWRTKTFTITSNLNRRWEVLEEELRKCQVLCRKHHREKTARDGRLGGGHNRWQEVRHGTLWAYGGYGCRCEPCRAAKRASRKSPAGVTG